MVTHPLPGLLLDFEPVARTGGSGLAMVVQPQGGSEVAVFGAGEAAPRPNSFELPTVLHTRDVGSEVAWAGLLRLGALTPLDLDAAVVAGTVITADMRAAALAPHIPTRIFVVGPSAVWVHCGGTPPPRLTLGHYSSTARPQRWEPIDYWSGIGLYSDSALMGLPSARVRVTTPVRTAVDVALRQPPDIARALLARLVESGLDANEALASLEARGHTAGRPRARRLLKEFASSA